MLKRVRMRRDNMDEGVMKVTEDWEESLNQ